VEKGNAKTLHLVECHNWTYDWTVLTRQRNNETVVLLRNNSIVDAVPSGSPREILPKGQYRTVARKSSIGGLYVCAGRLCVRAGGAWHSNLTNIPLTI